MLKFLCAENQTNPCLKVEVVAGAVPLEGWLLERLAPLFGGEQVLTDSLATATDSTDC